MVETFPPIFFCPQHKHADILHSDNPLGHMVYFGRHSYILPVFMTSKHGKMSSQK